MIYINISKDYSITPGGRYVEDGPFSGQDFRNKILEPAYKDAVASGQTISVNLDGGYGYATSFLEESFGGLARIHGSSEVRRIIEEIVSDDEPALIGKISEYIEKAEEKKKK